jgi:hypothetical protein
MFEIVLILFLLLSKHFLVDFPLQTSFQYLNKGTWLHLGGLLHSALHGVGTLVILLCFTTLPLAIGLAIMDFVLHYLIDYGKININRKLGYTPVNSEQFWWLLGLDQWLHQLTYLAIVLIMKG